MQSVGASLSSSGSVPTIPRSWAVGVLNFGSHSYRVTYSQNSSDIEERKLVCRIFEHVLHSPDPSLSQQVGDIAVAIDHADNNFVLHMQSQVDGNHEVHCSREEVFDSLQARMHLLAVEAHRIYAPRLGEVRESLTGIFETCGQVYARAKSPISAANRLARTMFAVWSSENPIVSIQDAVGNIWDAIGARIVLHTGNDEEAAHFWERICQAILTGSLSIVKVTNLRGPHGIPYFSDTQITMLKQADTEYRARNSRSSTSPLQLENKDRQDGSPFTCVCAYVRLDQGVTGELQMMGPKVLEIANAEHLPYDALIHKDLYRRLNALGREKMRPHFEPFMSAVRRLTPEQKRVYEREYLNECYIHARKVEKGLAPSDEPVPFPQILQNVPELQMENILHLEHEYSQVLEETKRS